jgi:hypothetical protein
MTVSGARVSSCVTFPDRACLKVRLIEVLSVAARMIPLIVLGIALVMMACEVA